MRLLNFFKKKKYKWLAVELSEEEKKMINPSFQCIRCGHFWMGQWLSPMCNGCNIDLGLIDR